MMRDHSGISEEMEIIFTITHEVAHNWFGNSLTVNNWCSVWLQESLATYIQAVIPTLVRFDGLNKPYQVGTEICLLMS